MRFFLFLALVSLACAQNARVEGSVVSITGRVTDGAGDPLERAQVTVARRIVRGNQVEMSSYASVETNDRGEYRLSNLLPGRYYVWAMESPPYTRPVSAPGPTANILTYFPDTPDVTRAAAIDVEAGAEVRAIDIRLYREKVFRIRGKIVGPDGAAVSNVALRTFPANQPGVTTIAIAATFSAMESMRKNDGTFEIPNLLPGTYQLRVPLGANVNGVIGDLTGQIAVTIVDADVDGVVLALAPGRSISGTVRVEDGGLPAGLRVALSGIGTFVNGSASTDVNNDGTFLLKTAPSGKFRVSVRGLPAGQELKSIFFGGADISSAGLDSASSAGASLDILLSTKAPK